MCGRFAQFTDKIRDVFDIIDESDEAPDLPFRYNIAPRQDIRIVIKDQKRRIKKAKWGLVTEWSAKKKFDLINIRAESLTEKKTLQLQFRQERCIIPADGFYEWKHEKEKKLPYYIYPKNGGLFAFAGLRNARKDADGKETVSCAIITTGPNKLMSSIHDRMPVILPKERWDQWLDNSVFELEKLTGMLIPFPDDGLELRRVSSAVNSPKNDSENLIKPSEG